MYFQGVSKISHGTEVNWIIYIPITCFGRKRNLCVALNAAKWSRSIIALIIKWIKYLRSNAAHVIFKTCVQSFCKIREKYVQNVLLSFSKCLWDLFQGANRQLYKKSILLSDIFSSVWWWTNKGFRLQLLSFIIWFCLFYYLAGSQRRLHWSPLFCG